MRDSLFDKVKNGIRICTKPLANSKLSRNFANLSLFLIYPGLFFYQSLIGSKWISPVIFGGWGVLMMILCPCLFLLYLAKYVHDTNKISIIECCFLAFFIFISISSIIYFFAGLPEDASANLFYWNLAGAVSNLTVFFAFRLANIEDAFFIFLSRMSAAVIILIVFLNTDFKALYFAFLKVEYLFTYQGFARSMLVVFLITCFSIKGGVFFFLCYLLFAFTFLVNQSRTESILFILVTPAIMFLKLQYPRNVIVASVLFGCCLITVTVVGVLLKYHLLTLDNFPYIRLLSLTDPSSDASYVERLKQSIFALETITKNPFFGDYGNYVAALGPGTYSHNSLSVWVNFGLLGFTLYGFILALLAYEVCKLTFNAQNLMLINFAGALGVSAIIAHLFSYTYIEVLLAAAIGLIAQVKELRNVERSEIR